MYCFMKLVVELPARLLITRSGRCWRTFKISELNSVASVGTMSLEMKMAPFSSMKRLVFSNRSWPKA